MLHIIYIMLGMYSYTCDNFKSLPRLFKSLQPCSLDHRPFLSHQFHKANIAADPKVVFNSDKVVKRSD